MQKIHIDQAPVNQSSSFTLPIFTVPPEFAPTWEHPAEQLAAILGQFPRAERRVIDIMRPWLTRPSPLRKKKKPAPVRSGLSLSFSQQRLLDVTPPPPRNEGMSKPYHRPQAAVNSPRLPRPSLLPLPVRTEEVSR